MRVRRVLDRVAALPVPVIAALNGHALGGGAEVAIAADIRVAADDVKIGFNQVSLGIMPAWGGAERLALTIGRSRALLAIATGEVYDAEAAQRLGLIDVVVARSTFETEWRALAGRMATTAPGTTRAVKAVIGAAAPALHPQLEAGAADVFARLWTADAHWAAVEALEQRRRAGG
jgi:enoyl-CoA hydratase/carnithine racemase